MGAMKGSSKAPKCCISFLIILSQFQLLKVMLVFFSLVFPCFKDDVVQGQCGLHNGYFMQLEGNVGRVGWLTIRKISHFWQIGCIPLLQYAEFGFWHIGKCYFLSVSQRWKLVCIC